MKLMLAEFGSMPPYNHVDTLGNVWMSDVDRECEPCHVLMGHAVVPPGVEPGDTIEVEDWA